MTSKKLTEQSLNETNRIRKDVEQKFLLLSPAELNRKPNTISWSAAECFQHLIFTNGEYLKHFGQINKQRSNQNEISETFKHSFWGKFILYFVNPRTKMKSKTTQSFNPSFSKVESDVIQKYLSQHDQLVNEIANMKNLNLRKLKMPSPINAKIKYNIGDAIRILILHDQRHIQQAERALGFKSQ